MLLIIVFFRFQVDSHIRHLSWGNWCSISFLVSSRLQLQQGISVIKFDLADAYDVATLNWRIIVNISIRYMLWLEKHAVEFITFMMLLCAHVVIKYFSFEIWHVTSINWHHVWWSMHLIRHGNSHRCLLADLKIADREWVVLELCLIDFFRLLGRLQLVHLDIYVYLL